MRLNLLFILLCAGALVAHAQSTTVAKAGPKTPSVSTTGATNSESYGDAFTSASATISVAEGVANLTPPYALSLNGSVLTTARCSPTCTPQERQTASVNGEIVDVLVFETPGVATALFTYMIEASGGDFTTSGTVCVGELCGQAYTGSGSPPPSGQITTSGNLPIALLVGGMAEIAAQAGGGAPTISPGVASIASSITSIVAMDGLGKTVSNVDYCTASGKPLPILGGKLSCPLFIPHFNRWPLYDPGPISIDFGDLYANAPTNQLYVPVTGESSHVRVLNLETLTPVGEISNVSATAVTVSLKSGHGFSSSNPILMWDTASLRVEKSIPLDRGVTPGAILLDPQNDFVYLFHQEAPLATVLRASDGAALGTITLGGFAKEAVTDGKGNVYAGIQGADGYLVDVLGFTVNGALGINDHWLLGGTCSGIAMDSPHAIFFATCKSPAPVISTNGAPTPPTTPFQLEAFQSGKLIPNSRIGVFSAAVSAAFNPTTAELFSLGADGTMTIVKESSSMTFFEERYLTATSLSVKSVAVDSRTGHVFYTGEDSSSGQPGSRVLYYLAK